MSNLTLKSAFKEDKFNLKMVSTLFILVDLFLVGAIDLLFFFYLVLYQVSLIVALMFGLRGQGKYKTMMLSLQSIARNRDLSIDERESRLVNGIHHHCLELGYIYEERNKKYGLFGHKKKKLPGGKNPPGVKKKTKNLEVKKEMSKLMIDEVVWKQIGYSLVSVWELFIPVIALILEGLALPWQLILFLTGAWGIFGALVLFYIHYIFNLEQVITIEAKPGYFTADEVLEAARKKAIEDELKAIEGDSNVAS